MHAAGAVLWPAFLAAAGASVPFFAAFDPAELLAHATWPVVLTRGWAYTVFFFFFWLLAGTASALTWLLAGRNDG
ncbi:MAG: hypothetical protein KatS3mg121_1325 [Gammaproteobacteria bacterium]|nr:MAG: hypothetical protein KatS3mg121_1325 [Gammaproteobacteria bacterium]